VSAFSPITNPLQCPWGQKAFKGYLGGNEQLSKTYDACELAKCYNGPNPNILIDQGMEDQFLHQNQLLPENMEAACKDADIPLKLRRQEGYDHSYFFISTFMGDHVEHHARFLCQGADGKSAL